MTLSLLFRLGGVLALAAALSWGVRVDHLRGAHLEALTELRAEAETVVVALAEATGNSATSWESAPEQTRALGDSRRALATSLVNQNASIAAQARAAVAREAEAEELRELVRRAQAQRASAFARLEQLALTPGTRDDCEQLVAEAEEALDLVREAGL